MATEASEELIKKKDEWVATFLDLEQNSFFCRISDSYLADNFELYELDRAVSNYKFALNLVRNRRREAFEHLTVDQKQTIANSATILYGLIHARFIITKRGLEKMKRKYISNDFGLCQRNNCNEHSLLPTAITDEKGKECVRLYCSNCCDIYLPIKECYKNIDGSYFGTTFAHLFLLSFPIFKPKQSILDCRTPKYTPKIFGFRLHKTWHNIALKEWNQKHYANNEFEHKQMNKIVNDTQSNEVHYLMKVKEKQKGEILRLEHIIQKQQGKIDEINSLNKKQSIQLLTMKTKIQIIEQQQTNVTMGQQSVTVPAAPVPVHVEITNANDDERKGLGNENGFQDILEQLNERVTLMKNKNKMHLVNNKDLETYQNQLDQIYKLANSFNLYLNQTGSNGM